MLGFQIAPKCESLNGTLIGFIVYQGVLHSVHRTRTYTLVISLREHAFLEECSF